MPVKTRAFSSPDDLVEFVNGVQKVTAAAIVGAGIDYTQLDVLVVAGGDPFAPTRIRVDTVGGTGNITGVTVVEQGEFRSVPSNPASVTGGTGSGATFNLTSSALLVKADVGKITERSHQWFLNYWV